METVYIPEAPDEIPNNIFVLMNLEPYRWDPAVGFPQHFTSSF